MLLSVASEICFFLYYYIAFTMQLFVLVLPQVRLQTQSTVNPTYTGFVDCVRKTVAADGALGLYRGWQSPLIGQCFMNAWQFAVWGNAKKLVADKNNFVSIPGYFLAGAITGCSVAIVECPVDLFKTQLQTNAQYKSFGDCVKTVFSNHGIRGAYQGLTPTIIRNTVAVSNYFGFYELTKQYLAEGDQYAKGTLELWKLMIAGSVGGVMYWPFVYPIDCMKSAMQSDKLVHDRRFPNLLAAYKGLVAEGGYAKLWAGFTPCMLRAVPANAVCFALFEYTARSLRDKLSVTPTLAEKQF
jgi:solute carrier family 25 carnitine/acylcarnitine transporter 20/29